MILRLWGAVLLAAPFLSPVAAETALPPPDALTADVVFLGEQHDNPAHHAVQAAWVAQLAPSALVFEMLTAPQAARVTSDNRSNEAALKEALAWDASGWPQFSMYFPIFAAAPEAAIYGAGLSRDALREMMDQDPIDVIGAETAAQLDLNEPLPAEQQATREALQSAAHCDAMPEEFLPRMVTVQRVRDAALAQAALKALQETGGPVAVITGNGHAREDWGAPFMLRLADTAVIVFSLGQGEAGQMPDGGFGLVVDGPAVDRGDHCDAFRK